MLRRNVLPPSSGRLNLVSAICGMTGRRECVHYVQYWVQSSRDNSVGVATSYGLDGSRIESLRRRNITHPSVPALWPIDLRTQWVRSLSQGNVAGAWRWPPKPLHPEVKNSSAMHLLPFRAFMSSSFLKFDITFTGYNPSIFLHSWHFSIPQIIPNAPWRWRQHILSKCQ